MVPSEFDLDHFRCLSDCLIWFFSYKVKETPGLKILQFNAPLYYANVEHFMNMFFEHAKGSRCTTGDADIIQNFSVNGIENHAILSDSFGQYDEVRLFAKFLSYFYVGNRIFYF